MLLILRTNVSAAFPRTGSIRGGRQYRRVLDALQRVATDSTAGLQKAGSFGVSW